jgi:hypothetical protein
MDESVRDVSGCVCMCLCVCVSLSLSLSISSSEACAGELLLCGDAYVEWVVVDVEVVCRDD